VCLCKRCRRLQCAMQNVKNSDTGASGCRINMPGMANEDEWLSFSNMLLYLMKMVLSVMVFINLLRGCKSGLQVSTWQRKLLAIQLLIPWRTLFMLRNPNKPTSSCQDNTIPQYSHNRRYHLDICSRNRSWYCLRPLLSHRSRLNRTHNSSRLLI